MKALPIIWQDRSLGQLNVYASPFRQEEQPNPEPRTQQATGASTRDQAPVNLNPREQTHNTSQVKHVPLMILPAMISNRNTPATLRLFAGQNWKISGLIFTTRPFESVSRRRQIDVMIGSDHPVFHHVLKWNLRWPTKWSHCAFDKFGLGVLWSHISGRVLAQHSFPLHTHLPQ